MTPSALRRLPRRATTPRSPRPESPGLADLHRRRAASTCHAGATLGGTMFQKLGLVKPYGTEDAGRFDVTGQRGRSRRVQGAVAAQRRADRPLLPRWLDRDARRGDPPDGRAPARQDADPGRGQVDPCLPRFAHRQDRSPLYGGCPSCPRAVPTPPSRIPPRDPRRASPPGDPPIRESPMSSPNEAAVLDALRPIIDPDFGKSIVDLGFVKNLRIDGASVAFEIELTTPACPVKAEFERAARERVAGAPRRRRRGGHDDREYARPRTAPSPAGRCTAGRAQHDRGRLGQGRRRQEHDRDQPRARARRTGASVGVLDADVYGPSLPLLTGVHGRPGPTRRRSIPTSPAA